nr:MAG TPA: baseplate protein [Caudoviricetes sp.]
MSSNYELAITLPSKGVLYSDEALKGEIIISMLTTKDEKEIFGSSNIANVLDNLIRRHTKPRVNPDELLQGDYMYILFKLRQLSYGDEYTTEEFCNACGEERKFKYNISDIQVYDNELQKTYTSKMPISGDIVEWRLLTNGDFKRMDKDIKQSGERIKNFNKSAERYVQLVERALVSINGNELKSGEARAYVENMVGRDSAFIRNEMGNIKTGLRETVLATCTVCGNEQEVSVAMNGEFFRPDFDVNS